ncbi:hypothetical protein HDU83_004737 [Entophlyctis luteolus]|nr:hypothetical protein HDU83_004737 [Entophlyctis luteolus]KAJ3387973.1 hypothetical protein HDU84_000364 [Entophlyctis sp. JEL0112]
MSSVDVPVLNAQDIVTFSTTTTADRMAVVCTGLYQHGFVEAQFSDITVRVLNKEYNLHRLTLVNNRYFALRIGEVQGKPNPMTGKFEMFIPIDDPNITHEALTVVFARMYGHFEDKVTGENFKSLLATAYFFHDRDLCIMCADYIKTIEYNPQNALEYISYASTFDYGETSLLLLRHVLIFLCRDGASDQALVEQTFPYLDFAWFARIVQSDTFVIPSEFLRFQFIANVLRKRFQLAKFADMKDAVQHMTSHVLSLGRLPPTPDLSNSTPMSFSEDSGLEIAYKAPAPKSSRTSVHVNPAVEDVEPSATGASSVVFLGRPSSLAKPNLPQAPPTTQQELTDAAITLISKAILYAHIPLPQYAKIREESVVPGFVFDRHFRIHHDMIRLVDTTPKGIQKLGIAYHYQRKNVVVRDGPPESFFDIIMAPVFAHDLLEMPPFRFGVEFGGRSFGGAPVEIVNGKGPTMPAVNPLLKVVKGGLGDGLVSKAVPYAGSLYAIRIERSVREDGVHCLEVLLTRKPGTKETTVCIDTRPEAKFWCRIVAYCSSSSRVTEAYTFETSGVNFLQSGSRIGNLSAELFKELYLSCTGPDGAAASLRVSVLLGVL